MSGEAHGWARQPYGQFDLASRSTPLSNSVIQLVHLQRFVALSWLSADLTSRTLALKALAVSGSMSNFVERAPAEHAGTRLGCGRVL